MPERVTIMPPTWTVRKLLTDAAANYIAAAGANGQTAEPYQTFYLDGDFAGYVPLVPPPSVDLLKWRNAQGTVTFREHVERAYRTAGVTTWTEGGVTYERTTFEYFVLCDLQWIDAAFPYYFFQWVTDPALDTTTGTPWNATAGTEAFPLAPAEYPRVHP